MDYTAFIDEHSGQAQTAQALPLPLPANQGLDIPTQPFAWQNGNQLLLLDVDQTSWLFAELEFVPDECRYIEIRRAAYDWPREAVGALLSRALSSGDSALIDTVEQLDIYCHRHFNFTIVNC